MEPKPIVLDPMQKVEVIQKLKNSGLSLVLDPYSNNRGPIEEYLDMQSSVESSDRTIVLVDIWPKYRDLIVTGRYDPKNLPAGFRDRNPPIAPLVGHFNMLYPGSCYKIHHHHPAIERSIEVLVKTLSQIREINDKHP